MKPTFVQEYVASEQGMRLFQQERAILEATNQICELMKELGVSRAELARRLGKTKGFVTQLLDEEANKTIRTVADVFAVLGREFRSSYRPIQIGNQSAAAAPILMSGDLSVMRYDPNRPIIKMSLTGVNRMDEKAIQGVA